MPSAPDFQSHQRLRRSAWLRGKRLAQDNTAIVGVLPLRVFDEPVAEPGVPLDEVHRRLRGIEGKFPSAGGGGASFDIRNEPAAESVALQARLDRELAERGDIGPVVPGAAIGAGGIAEQDGAADHPIGDGDEALA